MRRLITWFAENGVAANLLMVLLLFGGILTVRNLRLEVFPELSSDTITVTIEYLGAAPEEIEEAVCIRVEEAIHGIDGIKQLTSEAKEGVGTIIVEVMRDHDTTDLLDRIKTRVDAIDTFPEETEKPVIEETILRKQVINIAIGGDTDERSLKQLGERIRDDLLATPGITQVKLANVRPYEISIEVSEDELRRFGLSFQEVADSVRRSSLDLPGGSIETEGGEILIRTEGQAYRGEDFEALVLRAGRAGERLLVGDVARVIDGFAETDQSSRFDGVPAVLVQVFRVGDQNALEISQQVKEYAKEAARTAPEGITITTWQDDSENLRERLQLLLRNGRMGLLLVVLILGLFFHPRIAFWVALGIPISFLGSIWLMPTLDISINLISLFAFIIVLGIVVDDAIIVGENIYTQRQSGKKGLQAAIDGTLEVFVPVGFAVLTSIAAFTPLLNVPGANGQITKVIALIVITTLIFSLVESLLILPAHLVHTRLTPTRFSRLHPERYWLVFQQRFDAGLALVIRRVYQPTLRAALEWRYVTMAAGITIIVVVASLVGSGKIRFLFLPQLEGDNVVAMLSMPRGTTAKATSEAMKQIESAAAQLEGELEQELGKSGEGIFRHTLTSIADQPFRYEAATRGGQQADFNAPFLGEVNIELMRSEQRTLTATEIARRWRELTGPVPDATSLTFSSTFFSTGAAIDIQLAGTNLSSLKNAAEELKLQLADYPAVQDITDSFDEGKQEVKLRITQIGQALGLTLADLARQVRQGFYGEEVQRVQRGRDEVRVMVRYPKEERRSLGSLEQMRIRLPDGTEAPFSSVARATLGRGFSTIKRVDRQKVVNVTADVDSRQASPNEVLNDVLDRVLPALLARHPGVRYTLEGEQREQRDVMAGLLRGFLIAIVVIYGLLAIPFRSYVQPVIIMTGIPFGLVGAVLGHMIMGIDLTILSLFGVVALTGVIVNDSLLLVDFINRKRADGMSLGEAVRQSGIARFRPILVTSLTTFVGLSPLILEKSLQAKFLIPLAVSLGFGVIFATGVTLVVVPVCYVILEDLRSLGRSITGQPARLLPDENRA